MIDSATRSWVATANDPATDFPIQNLPFGVFRAGSDACIGVAIGDRILDLRRCVADGLLGDVPTDVRETLADATLNRLMALGRPAARALRSALAGLL